LKEFSFLGFKGVVGLDSNEHQLEIFGVTKITLSVTFLFAKIPNAGP
jgi:hypothetical protein